MVLKDLRRPPHRSGAGMQRKERKLDRERETAMSQAGPTWRGFVLAILAAILLSGMATLLLGGSSSFGTRQPATAGAPGGCGSGGNCCRLQDPGK
jgi:hypothetical protein